MKIYACGSRPDHFTGWGGTGNPVYESYAASDANQVNGLGNIALNTGASSGEPNGWGYGCLWLDFKDSSGNKTALSDFWVGMNGYFLTSVYGPITNFAQYSGWVLHSSSGTYLMSKCASTTAYGYELYLSPSLSDTTQYIDIGISIPRSSGTGLHILDIHVSGAGTSDGLIEAYRDGVLMGSWSGDMTDYADFNALSFHRDNSSGSTCLSVTYGFVTDTCTVGHNFNTESIAKAPDLRADWTGDVTTFTTYPPDYTSAGGLYATSYNVAVSFAPVKTYAAPAVGSYVGAVVMQGSLVSDEAIAQVSAFAISSDGLSTATGAPVTINQTGKNVTYTLTTNPISGSVWNITDVNSVEFGFARLPDLGSATNDFGGDIE